MAEDVAEVEEKVAYQLMMRDIPTNERPRERLQKHGEQSLATSELVALILRTGSGKENVLRLAERLLARFGDVAGLSRASLKELQEVKGIGPAKAIEIKAALELGRRLAAHAPSERPCIRTPDDAANLLMSEMCLLEQEHLRVLLLDTRKRVTKVVTVYIGTINSSVVRIAEVMRPAIKESAASFLVAHNHPSGDPAPSPEDVRVTQALYEAGQLFNIELVDHIIIGRQRYVSLRTRGLGFG